MTGENDPGLGKTVAFQMLRKRAEDKVAAGNKPFTDMSASEMSTLIHELRIHQVELEMQNEELRKSQAETERSRKTYQDLWQLSPVGYLIVDFAGRVTAANHASLKLFGRPENALLNERFATLVTPESQVPVHLMFERALETGIAERQEIGILKPDGASHICLMEIRSLGGARGREQIQVVLTDITRHKRAEDDLKKNEQEKTAILDSLVEHVVYQDREMKILWANRAACESVQMKRKDLLGRYCHEIWADRRRPCEDCPVRKAHDTKQPQRVEKMTPDGRWWYIQGHQVLDHNGQIIGMAEITLNITDRKRAEEALRAAKDDLEVRVEQRTADLVEVNGKLRQEIKERKRSEKKLHEAKNLLSNTFNAIQDMVVVIDKDFRVSMSNWKGHDYISEKDRRGHPYCYEVFVHRNKPCRPCHATEVFAAGETKQAEVTNPIDEKIRDIRVFPLLDDKGEMVGVIEHLRDITDRKQAEQALAESEEKYRQLFENDSDAVMIFDAETRQFEDANRTTLDLYGYSKDEFLTLKVDDISVEKEKTRSNVKRIRDGGEFTKRVPLRYFKKKDDTVFPGEISVGRFTIGGRLKIIGAVRDITERIRAEEALQESEERYRHLVDCARDIIYIVSSDATILSMNPAIENMTGWSPSECRDKHLASFFHPDDFPLAMEMGQRALQGDTPPIHEVRIRSKSGKYVIGEFSIAPYVQRGSVVGILGVGRDITVRKKLETALKNQANKLFERVKELNCFYGISELLEKPGHSLEQILQGIVDLMPLGWQYPEITGVKLDLHEKIYATKNFKETIWKQAYDIHVHGDPAGTLKVCYLEENPSRDDEPFLKEEKKRKSEARYRALSEATFEGIFISEKGICLDTNQSAAELFGYDYNELIGIFATDVIAVESKELVKRHILSGYEKPYEAIAQKKDGTKFYVEIRGQMMRYENRDVRITVIRDIDEQKHAVKGLRQSEKRYRDLFNSIPIGLYRTTPEGSILDVNPAMLEILGCPDRNTLLRVKSPETYVDPNDREQYQRMLEEKGFVHDFTVQLRRHDGRSIWVSINTSIVHDSDSQMTYYEGAMADISERKASEEQIRKLSQQLIQAQEDERQMISRELHDTVAQDLSVAKMACDLIYGELLNNRPPEAQRIQEICEALKKTISGVRDMAYELRPPELEELGLVETIYRFCEDFTQMWGLPVDFQSAGLKDLKLDYGIQINLYRLVQEGLTNIRKHAAAGRAVLKLTAAFPNIILRVEDNGRGFDVDERAASASQEKRMGLRSMQERVTLLNGEMNLKSKPGQGTKVFIKLPFAKKKRDVKENHLNS